MIDMIEKYISEMEANGRSSNTIRLYRIVLEKLNNFKPLNKITKDDLIKFFKELQGSDSTKSLHQVIIKKYFKDIGKRPLVEWIKIIRPKETLHPDDIPTASEINKMIEATDSYYFKALIAFLFEGGPRISEASGNSGEEKKRLRYRDFVDTVDGMT
jgi:integrase